MDWARRRDGVMSPPDLLSGHDFHGVTSPHAFAATPRPWLSMLDAARWANSEFTVAITPLVFCQLAAMLQMDVGPRDAGTR